jgi:hypothetical protein
VTPHQRRCMRDLVYALSWHCLNGAGPRGMDMTFIAEARSALAAGDVTGPGGTGADRCRDYPAENGGGRACPGAPKYW